MSKEGTTDISVSLGDDSKHATIRFSDRSFPVVAGVLGIEHDANGRPVRLYLDSRIHRDTAGEYRGWKPWGAISTILERMTEQPK
jgi:hypothetical protein